MGEWHSPAPSLHLPAGQFNAVSAALADCKKRFGDEEMLPKWSKEGSYTFEEAQAWNCYGQVNALKAKTDDRNIALIIMLAPPSIVFMLGLVVGWVVNGFRPKVT